MIILFERTAHSHTQKQQKAMSFEVDRVELLIYNVKIRRRAAIEALNYIEGFDSLLNYIEGF